MVMKLSMLALFEPYRVPSDPFITATEAGESVQALGLVGTAGEPPHFAMRAPVRRYPEPIAAWGGEPPAGFGGMVWGRGLLEAAASGFTDEQRAYLEHVAAQHFQDDIVRFARAGEADIGGTRWVSPMPVELSAMEWPIPRFGQARNVFFGGVHAAHDLHIYRPIDACQIQGSVPLRFTLEKGRSIPSPQFRTIGAE
jgi:hypothetical protein